MESKVVVELAPRDALAQANLGFVYFRLSVFQKAEKAFRAALALDPKNKIAKAGLKELNTSKKKTYQNL